MNLIYNIFIKAKIKTNMVNKLNKSQKQKTVSLKSLGALISSIKLTVAYNQILFPSLLDYS